MTIPDGVLAWSPREQKLERARAQADRAARLGAYIAEWTSAGFDPRNATTAPWEQIPMLSKVALIEAGISAPPFGGRLGVAPEELATVFAAPGPLYMPFTDEDFSSFCAAQARAFVSCGFRAGDLVDQTMMYNWVLAGTFMATALRMVGCGVVPGGPGDSKRHVEVINELGVNAVVAFPTFLGHLLEVAEEQGVSLPIRKAAIAGEIRDSDFKPRLLSVHGITAREMYGVAEVSPIAYECECGTGLHLRDDVLVEFIDPDTRAPLAPDDPSLKEIVVTEFDRRAMPVVRLRTGDLVAALELDQCGCGSSAPRLQRIVGRTGAIPRIKGMFVVPRTVGEVLRRFGASSPYQLRIERPGAIDTLTVVIEREGAPPDLDALKVALQESIRVRPELLVVDRVDPQAPVVDDRRDIS